MRPSTHQAFVFRARETVRDGVRRLASSLEADAQLQAARPIAEHSEAVHAMRLVLKRLRALLRLLRQELGEAVVRRLIANLRDAARHLAPARDAAVGLHTLDSLAHELRGSPAESIAGVRAKFAEVAHDHTSKPSTIAKALRTAASVVRRTVAVAGRRRWKRHGWPALEGGLQASYRRARRRFRAAHTTGEEESFHAWRTASKSLMYQLAMVRPAEPKGLGRFLGALNTLQKSLGDEHDLAVVAKQLGSAPGRFGGKEAVTRSLALIAARQQRLRKQTLKVGRVLFTDRPKHFASRRHREWKAWRKD